MIYNLEDLINIYNFINSEKVLNNLETELNKMTIIPKLKMEMIKENEDFIKINYLKDLRVKKVRKNLLSADFDLIKKFNESLKLKYPDKRWIQYMHNKENWINEILVLIKKRSRSLYYNIEILAGYDSYEKARLDFDWRIVNVSSLFYSTSHYYIDPYDNSPEWSEKITCRCLENINNYDYLIFKKGEKYFYRINSEKIIVYSDMFHFSFESDSFYEYFSSRESRDRKIDFLLNSN